MDEKDLVMIATLQDDLYIYKLLNSIDDSLINIRLEVILVSQNVKVAFLPKNKFLTITILNEGYMGLSKARNIALRYLYARDIRVEYIMFPDDDSSFDEVFFKNFSNILGSKKNYVSYIYNENSKSLYLGKQTEDDKKLGIKDYHLVGSPNQIIQYRIMKNKIYFNNQLGVGAKFGSSEDLDLFISISLDGHPYHFIKNLYSYHPSKLDIYSDVDFKKILKRFKSYSSGFAYVVFRYKQYNLLPNYFIRTLLAFLFYLTRFKFKLSLAYLIQLYFRVFWFFYFLFDRTVYKVKN